MKSKGRSFIALLLGLVIGWYVAEKGWHRHLFYLAVIVGLIAALRG